MDDRGRLARQMTGMARWRSAPGRIARPRPPGRGRRLTACRAQPLVAAARAGPRGWGSPPPPWSCRRPRSTAWSRAVTFPRSWQPCKEDARSPRQCRRVPDRVDRALRPSSADAEEVLASPASPARTSLLFLDVDAARSVSRPIPGSPKRPCASSIPGRCRSRSGSATPLRSGRRTARLRDRRRRHRARAVCDAGACCACRWWSARRQKSARRIFSRCSIAIPTIRDQVRASILVGERRWNLKLKNGIDVACRRPTRQPRSTSWRARPRQAAPDPRHRGGRSAAARPGDRAAVRWPRRRARSCSRDKKKKGGDA